jgi:hypothetical protein
MMLSPEGSTLWFIPDGYLATPLENDPVYKNHESICVMNVTEQDAHLLLDFYFAYRLMSPMGRASGQMCR